MFGYVKVENTELKVKEYEFYRGTYCGLCRSMGKCTGQCSRMTLNYDFVFLALVRIALLSPQIKFSQKRCLAHPFKKRNSMLDNEVLKYCSGASAILNYQKIADDISDEKGFKKFKAQILLPFVAHARKKAIKKDPRLSELDLMVSGRLDELSAIEKSEGESVDIPANCFGALLGDIMAFGLDGANARVAYELGKHIGAWIYIADAIDDMTEDLKKNRYNPLIKLYDGKFPTAQELESVSCAIRNRLYGAEAAFDLFPVQEGIIQNIIRNVLYLGIPNKTDDIIDAHIKENTRKEITND